MRLLSLGTPLWELYWRVRQVLEEDAQAGILSAGLYCTAQTVQSCLVQQKFSILYLKSGYVSWEVLILVCLNLCLCKLILALIIKAKSHILGTGNLSFCRLGPYYSKWLVLEKLMCKPTSSSLLMLPTIHRVTPSKKLRRSKSTHSTPGIPTTQLMCSCILKKNSVYQEPRI